MSDPAYDGICGVACPHPLRDGSYLRCRYEFGHAGDHSWHTKAQRLTIFGGITAAEVEDRARQGSIAAQAILAAGRRDDT